MPPIYLWARVIAAVVIWPCLGNPAWLRVDVAGFATIKCQAHGRRLKAISDVTGIKPLTTFACCESWLWGQPNGKTATAAGKRLRGLHVTGSTPLPGVLRQALKLFPLLLAALATTAVPFPDPELATHTPLVIRAALATFWYYLLPRLQGQHATRYDRWLGLTVETV